MSLKSVMGRGLLAGGMALTGFFTAGTHPALANHEQLVGTIDPDRGAMFGNVRWVSNKAFLYDVNVSSRSGDNVYAEWRQNRAGTTTWKRLTPSTTDHVNARGRKEGFPDENPWLGVSFRICWDRGGVNTCGPASPDTVNDFS